MAQAIIKPSNPISGAITFTPTADISITSVENIHALQINFAEGDSVAGGTELKITEGYDCLSFVPEVIINYT